MIKVLIVEDHASMRESLTTALTAAGDFTVVVKCPMPIMLWISASTCVPIWC